MGQLSVREYDMLERAIVDAARIAVVRQGSELLVIPEKLLMRAGKESIVARHPTTGASMTIPLDEVERISVVPRR